MASANLRQIVVKLDVGGVSFKTTLSTLTRYPESMFAIWFANWNAESKEEYFIDHDGSTFKHVLEFLRYGESIVLPEEDQCLKRLIQAADYFQLPHLQALVQLKLQDADKKGLSGGTLQLNTVVKFSSYGTAACVDSFVAHSFDFVQTSAKVPLVLGVLHPSSVSPEDDATLCVRCPSCLSQRQYCDLQLNETQLHDTLTKHRGVFADQLKLAQFMVDKNEKDDCVVITALKKFGGNRYHVAKSFLCVV